MAASSSLYPSSPSESDSDKEPNSHGARVFWGNLKTPEKSRSAFVDPPQTVVRTQPALNISSTRKSTGLSTFVQDNKPPQNLPQMVEESDELLDPAHSNNDIMSEVAQTQENCDVNHPHLQCSSNDGNDTCLSKTRGVSQQLGTTKMLSLESSSESEIELEPVLQPSSPVDAPSPLYICAQDSEAGCQLPTHPTVAHFMESPMTAESRGSRASELPDLISFNISAPPRLTLPEFQSPTSPYSSLTPPSQLSPSSSNVTVDNLINLSPIGSKSPLLQFQVLEAQSNPLGQGAAISASLSTPEPALSHQERSILSGIGVDTHLAPVQTTSPASLNTLVQEAASLSEPEVSQKKDVSTKTVDCLFEIAANTDPSSVETTFPLPSANDIGAPPLQSETTTINTSHNVCTVQPSTTEDGPATPGLKSLDAAACHTPRQAVISLPSTSLGETRKRSPAKGLKGKEKARDDDNNLEKSSNNTSSEFISFLGHGDGDKAAKKGRRTKVKLEAEHRRQQLLSLSPMSANVLSLLSSPDRDTPARPIGLSEPVSDFAMDTDPPNGSTPVEPETPRMTAAGRIQISVPPQRSEGSPLRFITPCPIDLSDPNRTPARRIPLPSDSQMLHPLPIDDPNRTPARRVLNQPSPTRLAEPTEPLMPQIRIEEGSPVNQAMPFSAKSSTQPLSFNMHDKTTSLSSLGSPRLPFPIRRNVIGATTVTSVKTSRPNPDSGTSKSHPPSNLRQPSSTCFNKFTRIATKPYTRTAQGPSRLPVTSFMRGPGSIASAGSTFITTSAGLSKPHISPANPAPSRIPSPSKRPAPLFKPTDPSTTPSASASADVNGADKAPLITAYKRKRQRMISEDEPDEPPAKRAVIMVRPVIKGMYNKTSNPGASESAMVQTEASPAHPFRPPGSIQIRPVIPGTLRHFETTRGSSRELLNDPEQGNDLDTQPTATRPSDKYSDTAMGLPLESREETPLRDIDTASTVTTISREPTLEELPDIYDPRSETTILSDSGPELRRTTRVRKLYGDALGIPSTSRATLRRDPMPLTRTTSMVQGVRALYSKGSSRSTTRAGEPQDRLPFNPKELQALTDANTLRNQTCVTDLHRKIVRRHGPRPDSPTTKVRTIMEKSREELSKGREARAERRRRREQESNMSASSEGDYMDVPSSPTPDKQPFENGHLTKHARGPGDEEDYETPVRPATTSRVDPNKSAKTVKWDRGLARTISDWAAEQIANNVHEEAAAEAIRKSCLVRDRTTLRLDPLGNVPDANEPLKDLERERIVVTRFIYDDDVDAIRTAKKKKT